MVDVEEKQAEYEQLCEDARLAHLAPRWVDESYRRTFGLLPGSDGRTKPEAFKEYEKRYSGAVLRKQFADASLGALVVKLVRTGHSGVVTRKDDYDRYAALCRDEWAKWRSNEDGIEFFPSPLALKAMERGNSDDGSLDGLGSLPPWHRAPRMVLHRPSITRGTWFLALAATLWSTLVVGALVHYQNPNAEPEPVRVSLLLLAITVGGGVLIYANLRPEVRSFVEDRLLSTANFAVLVSALVVPIAASFFIRDYRQTQIQADLTKALMEHMSKGAEEGELSASQLALMIDLLDKNRDKFGLELGGFRQRLEEIDEVRRVEQQRQEDAEAEQRAKEQERSFQDLQTTLSTTRAEKEASEEEQQRLQKEKTELDSRIAKLNEEYDEAKTQASKQGKSARRARASLKGLEREKKELEADRANREKRLGEIVQESKDLAIQVEEKAKALTRETERAKEIEKARQQLIEKAAEDNMKYIVLTEDMAKVTTALGEAQNREHTLREEIDRLRTSKNVLEQEVRQTVRYYTQRAKQYSGSEGERPSFETLAEKTAAKALQALEALTTSGVKLTEDEVKRKGELELLLKQAKEATNGANPSAGTGTERTKSSP